MIFDLPISSHRLLWCDRQSSGLPFAPKEAFKKADLDERQDLYTQLANECWSPKRLMEV
ncbi:hypothetical protein [Yoonia litorea]|uniref:hypothetical protein n=1 Tax=Yoonia litorea TaxID=1123755 RepID=UPI0013F4C061|nr:hypothetical protein [Yoonia litorea]